MNDKVGGALEALGYVAAVLLALGTIGNSTTHKLFLVEGVLIAVTVIVRFQAMNLRLYAKLLAPESEGEDAKAPARKK